MMRRQLKERVPAELQEPQRETWSLTPTLFGTTPIAGDHRLTASRRTGLDRRLIHSSTCAARSPSDEPWAHNSLLESRTGGHEASRMACHSPR